MHQSAEIWVINSNATHYFHQWPAQPPSNLENTTIQLISSIPQSQTDIWACYSAGNPFVQTLSRSYELW